MITSRKRNKDPTMNKCMIFALIIGVVACFVATTTDASIEKLQDCHDKLENATAKLPIPSQMVEAAEAMLRTGLSIGRYPSTFNGKFYPIEYLKQLSPDEQRELVETSRAFHKAANALLQGVDCDKSDLYVLIDVDNLKYENLVEPLGRIDQFNGFFRLSDRIISYGQPSMQA